MRIIRSIKSVVNYMSDMVSFMRLPEAERKQIIRNAEAASRAKEAAKHKIEEAAWYNGYRGVIA